LAREGEDMSTPAASSINLATRVRFAISDARVVTWRNLMQFARVPVLVVFSLFQPIMFVLLFRYVFGGAIANLGPFEYVNYLLPGIFVQTAIFGSTQTGIGLAEDLKSGLIDRFRSLPMARSAVLAGRTTSDLVRNLVVVLLMIGIGYAVGFSFQGGLLAAIGAILLVLAVGFCFSWVSAAIGLAIKDVESVQAASFTWIFPLTFVSSVFVNPSSMPAVLEAIARNNPITIWANAVRTLTLGDTYLDFLAHPPQGTAVIESLPGLLLKSAAWIVGILAIFVPLSIRLYRKLT
jgi:ABC-2 type transport system permease protein/oleandomycin transport system permease protein